MGLGSCFLSSFFWFHIKKEIKIKVKINLDQTNYYVIFETTIQCYSEKKKNKSPNSFWNFNYRLNNYYFCFCETTAPLTLNFHCLKIAPANSSLSAVDVGL